MYDVGDLVRLSTSVKDLSGALTNATVVLTITSPSGATSTPSVSNSSTGLYSATFTVDAEGIWLYKWSATGAVQKLAFGQITVQAQRRLIASMEEIKVQLNRTDTDDDDELRTYLTAATEAVEELIGGPISVTSHTEYHRASGGLIAPMRRPLVTVTSLTPDQGSAVDSSLYYADITESVVRLRFYDRRMFTLVYTAGLSTVPHRYLLAGRMIVQHLWMVQNGGAGAPFPGDTVMVPGVGFAIPRRAEQLLSPEAAGAGIA